MAAVATRGNVAESSEFAEQPNPGNGHPVASEVADDDAAVAVAVDAGGDSVPRADELGA